MNYLSLFSGMECAHQAWSPLGWQCVGVSEIEPNACALLAHRVPDAPNLGSVTEITDAQIAALGPIDVVIGGSPCQDLSVAGKRAGLAGARSCLFHEQLRIFHAARKHCGARWLVWENVPGAFSSNAGRDFAVVAGAMAGAELVTPADGWGSEGMALGTNGLVEWCVLDAQWFGVAQRRRRVFAVLDTGDWASRPPILLEPDGLRGDFAPSRETGEDVAPTIRAGAANGGAGHGARSGDSKDELIVPVWPAEVACTLYASFGSKQGLEDQHALGGGQLFVPAQCRGLPDDRNGAAVRPGDGDADSYFRGRLRCSAHTSRRRIRRERGRNGPRYAAGSNCVRLAKQRAPGRLVQSARHANAGQVEDASGCRNDGRSPTHTNRMRASSRRA
jgi:hypothetical protein